MLYTAFGNTFVKISSKSFLNELLTLPAGELIDQLRLPGFGPRAGPAAQAGVGQGGLRPHRGVRVTVIVLTAGGANCGRHEGNGLSVNTICTGKRGKGPVSFYNRTTIGQPSRHQNVGSLKRRVKK